MSLVPIHRDYSRDMLGTYVFYFDSCEPIIIFYVFQGFLITLFHANDDFFLNVEPVLFFFDIRDGRGSGWLQHEPTGHCRAQRIKNKTWCHYRSFMWSHSGQINGQSINSLIMTFMNVPRVRKLVNINALVKTITDQGRARHGELVKRIV